MRLPANGFRLIQEWIQADSGMGSRLIQGWDQADSGMGKKR